MKTYRTLTIVLAVLVALLAFLWLSGRKSVGPVETKEMWHTNTVQMWYTNTVDRWHTNTARTEFTNTVVQTVTNDVIREVAAQLSAQDRQAGAAGAKYLGAPSLASGGGPLYKVSPVAVEVQIVPGATNIVAQGADAVKKRIESALTARKVPVAAKSPYVLNLDASASWTTDVPRVAVLALRLDLTETVALQRQNDVIKCPATVWNTASYTLIRTVNTTEEVTRAVQQIVERFCTDYAKAKENEKEVEAKLPAVPRTFMQ